MTVVRVRLDKWLDSPLGPAPTAGEVIVNVRPLSERRKVLVRRVTVPAGTTGFRDLDLAEGRYAVEAVLPSSEVVSRDVDVGSDPVEVVLRGEYSPREWLSWHHLAGAVSASSFIGGPAVVRHDQRAYAFKVPERLHGSDMAAVTTEAAVSSEASLLRGLVAHASPGPTQVTYYSEGVYSTYIFQASEQFTGERSYFVAESPLGANLLAVLPDPWHRLDDSPRGTEYDVLIVSQPAPGEPGVAPGATCSVMVRDPVMATIVAYLGAGALPAAAEVLETASESLYAKLANPLAAAAGGFVLLGSWQGARSAREPRWFGWLANLSAWFPWLPDGAIQHGWRILKTAKTPEDVASGRTQLLEGWRRGLPFYSAGMRLLSSGLTLLAGRNPEDDEVLSALIAVRALALRTEANVPFTVIRLHGRSEP